LLPCLAALLGCTTEDPASAPNVAVRDKRERVAPSFERTVTETEPPKTLTELVEHGRHWRLTTKNGAIHVWIPDGYTRRRAETIIYVHGYYVNADQAWRNYSLAKQFAASAINAV